MTAARRAGIFKALSDPRRVDIVDLLSSGNSLCGTELAAKLGISISLLSHHWDVLVGAGVLKKERVGQLRICTLDLERIREAMGGWSATPAKARRWGRRKPDRGKKTARGPRKSGRG